jgi:hypothetical protein
MTGKPSFVSRTLRYVTARDQGNQSMPQPQRLPERRPSGQSSAAIPQDFLPMPPPQPFGAFGRCCLPPAQLRELRLAEALRRLHLARTTAFAPDGWLTMHHRWLLRSMWHNLQPGKPFVRKGPGWKDSGFQGEDPATDVRGGGLLAVLSLERFCAAHAAGVRTMIADVERVAAGSADGLRFYPLATVTIVATCKLCDALGLSDGLRGPISQGELDKLLLAALPTEHALAVLLVESVDGASACDGLCGASRGFDALCALLLADFHVRFFSDSKANYMLVQTLLSDAIAHLTREAQRVESLSALWAAYCANPSIAKILGTQQTTAAADDGARALI